MPSIYKFSDHAVLLFCRLGVAGLSPVAPGTCGSFLALLVAPVLFLPLPVAGRVALLVLLFWVGGHAATRAERILNVKDPGQVVIDELVGQWLTLLPFANPGWVTCLAGFVLFRLFDAAKPWPINASENWLPDGYGVMIDDVIAGIMAMICLLVLTNAKVIPMGL